MPRKNGFECLLEIKMIAELQNLPIIVFSTSLDPIIVDSVFERGAIYYIRKPCDFAKLKFSDKELEMFMIKKAHLGMNSGIMFGPGGGGFLRMNIACPRAILKQALNQLEEALDDTAVTLN